MHWVCRCGILLDAASTKAIPHTGAVPCPFLVFPYLFLVWSILVFSFVSSSENFHPSLLDCFRLFRMEYFFSMLGFFGLGIDCIYGNSLNQKNGLHILTSPHGSFFFLWENRTWKSWNGGRDRKGFLPSHDSWCCANFHVLSPNPSPNPNPDPSPLLSDPKQAAEEVLSMLLVHVCF